MIKANVFLGVLVLGFALAPIYFLRKNSEVRYDCSLAEFHPDYSPKVKEQCRKERAQQ
jgi:hypothetical protein